MAITSLEFDAVRKLVYDRSAIVLDAGKEYLVEARLQPLARARDCSLGELIARLRPGVDGALQTSVVEALTTNETAFFRDVKPFDLLRAKVLPEVIERRRQARSLSVWCAASSSGQEPYTIAMILREHFPQVHGWDIRILATDISSEMVERTRTGRYSQLEVNRGGVPAPMLVKYFDRVGLHWDVHEDLKRWVTTRQMNLAAPWGSLGRQDIVFCRNVLIYFDVETKRSILRRARDLVGPGGYLFLGAGETTHGLVDGFDHVDGGRGGCYRVNAASTRGFQTERRAS
jgi:chemotaxis protein methyltransferase CheR